MGGVGAGCAGAVRKGKRSFVAGQGVTRDSSKVTQELPRAADAHPIAEQVVSAAWSRLEAGELGRADELRRLLDHSTSTRWREWSMVLDVAEAHARGNVPSAIDSVSLEDPAAMARVAAIALRSAVFRLDSAEIDSAASLLGRLVRPEADSFTRDWTFVADGWRKIAGGRALGALPMPQDAVARVHCMMLRAMSADLSDDEAARTEAPRLARCAVRIAQTDGLAGAEHEARVVLARTVRRRGDIAQALTLLPDSPMVWCAWEQALCLAAETSSNEPPSRLAPVRDLQVLLDAAVRNREDARVKSRHLLETVKDFGPAHSDMMEIVAMIDPASNTHMSPAMRRFRNGESHEVPAPLQAMLDHHPDSHAAVVVGPDRACRTVAFASRPQAQSRPEELLCILAFEPGRTMEDAQLFRALYGTSLRTAAHRNLLDTLVYRARRLLDELTEGRANLVRRRGRCQLITEVAFQVWDPRVQTLLSRAILQRLAAAGSLCAGELARVLDRSQRTVQRMLRELVDERHCAAVRQGRHIVYRVRDPLESGHLLRVPDYAS